MSFLVNTPGTILKAAMDGRGFSVAECAAQLKTSERAIEAILNGTARMTPLLAFRAATLFSTSALIWLNSIILSNRSVEERRRHGLAHDEDALRSFETERLLQMSEAASDIFACCSPNPSPTEMQKGIEGARFLAEIGSYHDEALATAAERTVLYEGVASLVWATILGAKNDFRFNCLLALSVHDLSAFEIMAVTASEDSDPQFCKEVLNILASASPGLAQSRSLALLMNKDTKQEFRQVATDILSAILPYYQKGSSEDLLAFEDRILQGESWWIRSFIKDASGFSGLKLVPFIKTALQPTSGVAWEDAIEVLIARHTRLASHILIGAARSPISDIRADALLRLFSLDHPWAEEMAKQLTNDPDSELSRTAEKLWRCYGT